MPSKGGPFPLTWYRLQDELTEEEQALRARMTAIALTFPSMGYALGVKPWDALELDEWGSGPHSHGKRVAARFGLPVADGLKTSLSRGVGQPLDSRPPTFDVGCMETPIKRPWWSYLRLSVTGLMVLVLAVGGWLGWTIRGARIQRDAVAALRVAGGRVLYEWELVDGRWKPNGLPRWPGWVVERVGVDVLGSVVHVFLGPGCTDAELACAARLDRLETLIINGAGVTDAGLAQLEKLPRLRYLDLNRTPIADAALIHIEGRTGLEILWLEGTPVTDAGLVHLKGLTGLRNLHLAGTKVGDAGLASLEGLARLEELTVNDTGVGDAGLAHLALLARLRSLSLSGTRV